jgi:hypothetical protein
MSVRVIHWLLIALAAAVFWLSVQALRPLRVADVHPELRVAMPLLVQVAGAGGDRFLAANLAAIRALIVDTAKLKPEDYALLARVQADASWLNPAHEDNYYIAAAILPWSGHVDAAQTILRRATLARRFDYQPAFYYGFNALHFQGDAITASDWLRESASYLPEGQEKLQMLNLSAIWLDRVEDTALAIRVVESMAEQAKRDDFRQYLLARVTRLKALQLLRGAQARYVERTGQPLRAVDDLVSAGVMAELPADPFSFGYELDKRGRVVLRNSPAPKVKK